MHALKAPQSLNTKEITFLFKNSTGYYFTNQSGYLVQMVKRAKDTKYHIFPSDVYSHTLIS